MHPVTVDHISRIQKTIKKKGLAKTSALTNMLIFFYCSIYDPFQSTFHLDPAADLRHCTPPETQKLAGFDESARKKCSYAGFCYSTIPSCTAWSLDSPCPPLTSLNFYNGIMFSVAILPPSFEVGNRAGYRTKLCLLVVSGSLDACSIPTMERLAVPRFVK